ncbi:hypothetical protein CXF68_16305 [Tenacibaculum sp. Bg11-29]|uniref:hypothetical protein n=1 Tax=Tenacibaculum sp. Bg11-29 TaxID=2058306 RepID=UPI000C34D54B|nr:hypothetical protein [Tenacibaculum sp. Bg11-29]PKH52156.1 hypothetical protein CXF68_16305 [Tenacibaculum sp. Bg11-29]
MNRYSDYSVLNRELEVLVYVILVLLGLLIVVVIRNWYNLYKKRSFRKENTGIKEQLKASKMVIANHEKEFKKIIKLKEKLKEKQHLVFELEEEITGYKQKIHVTLNSKEKEIAQQKKEINHQKRAYDRYVDFKNVEANNTRLGAHFMKNVISQIYDDIEDIELGYKTFLGIQYKKTKEKKKIPSVKALKNIFKLLDYNVSALNTERTTIKEELKHINIFLELIQYLKPNAKILVHNSLSKDQNMGIKIKPTLFFPFLENALKHGDLNNESSFISIDIKENKQKQLSYCLVNSTEHFLMNKLNENISSKFGLNALKQLIDTYYPGSKIESAPISNNQYLAELTLNIK